MKETLALKKNSEFQRVYKRGKFSSGKWLTVYCYRNHLEIKRIGITVGKKIGKSVKRNRLKRLIRENYRLNEAGIPKGFDLVFVVRANEQTPDFYQIRKELRYHLKKLNLLNEELPLCPE